MNEQRAAIVDAVGRAVGEAWDDGNAVGLDGWVGPGRGTEPDHHAERRREDAIGKAIDAVLAHPGVLVRAAADPVVRPVCPRVRGCTLVAGHGGRCLL